MAGKGDKFRPTKLKIYRENFDQIDWKKDKNDTKNKKSVPEKEKTSSSDN